MSAPEDLIICRCEEVTLGEVLKAIREGAHSLDAVKRMTRAGMGLCQNKTCFNLIARLIHQETGIPLADLAALHGAAAGAARSRSRPGGRLKGGRGLDLRVGMVGAGYAAHLRARAIRSLGQRAGAPAAVFDQRGPAHGRPLRRGAGVACLAPRWRSCAPPGG